MLRTSRTGSAWGNISEARSGILEIRSHREDTKSTCLIYDKTESMFTFHIKYGTGVSKIFWICGERVTRIRESHDAFENWKMYITIVI